MEDGDTEKYLPSRVIQDFVFLSRKRGCIRCISLQGYNKDSYEIQIILKYLFSVKPSRFCKIYIELFWASLMVYKF